MPEMTSITTFEAVTDRLTNLPPGSFPVWERMYISPELAHHIKEHYHYEDNRDLRKDHVFELEKHMKNGTMEPYVSLLKFAFCEGKLVFIDGNHTCTAIENCGIGYRTDCQFFYCKDETELQNVYSSLDRNLTRRSSDMFRVFGLDHATGYGKQKAQMIMSAINILTAGFTGSKTSRRYRLDQREIEQSVLNWQNEFNIYEGMRDLSDHNIKPHMRRAPLIATVMAILRVHPKEGRDFFSHVFSGMNLIPSTPEHDLYLFVVSRGVHEVGIKEYCKYVASMFASRFLNEKVPSRKQQKDQIARIMIPNSIFDGLANYFYDIDQNTFVATK